MIDHVRIVFIGLGHMGQGVHLPCFLRAAGCEVVAVCDARPQLAAAVADAFRIHQHFSDHRQMLESVTADAAVIIMGPPAHVPVAIDCLAAGLHVFTEKPPATCLADALRLAEAAEAHQRCFQVAYMKRCDAGFRLARERIRALDQDRTAGPRQFARAHYFCGEWIANYPWKVIRTEEEPPPRPAPDAFPAPEFLHGMGTQFDNWFQQFCHAINMIRFLWGRPARVLHARFADWEQRPYEGLVTLLIDDMPVSLEMGLVDTHRWDEHYEVFYGNASIRVDAPPPLLQQTPASVRIRRQGSPAVEERLDAGREWSFQRQVDHFLEWIRGRAESVSTIGDAVKDVYLGEQIIRCARDNRPIDLDYPRLVQ